MNQENENLDLSPTQADYRKAMSENLHGCDINNVRVLSYQNKAPAPPEVR
jgi:cell division cycle protein 20 (cofactor of APC complex)